MTAAREYRPPMSDLFVTKEAVISDCGRYRYRLTRRWGDGPLLSFIMLNPSTADAEVDDPTIRRCMGFARRDGYGGIVVGNLYAFRTTKPKALFAADNPLGPAITRRSPRSSMGRKPRGRRSCAHGARRRTWPTPPISRCGRRNAASSSAASAGPRAAPRAIRSMSAPTPSWRRTNDPLPGRDQGPRRRQSATEGGSAMINRPLTMNEAAHALGVSRRWLQDFLPTIAPCHLQAGRKKLFDEVALSTIREAMRCRTSSTPQARDRRSGMSGERNSESPLTEALRLATGSSRPGSLPNGEPKRNVTPFPVPQRPSKPSPAQP